MTTKSKKVIVAFTPGGSDQSLFFRLWKLHRAGTFFDPGEAIAVSLKRATLDIDKYAEQMSRQQAHVDEIKRMCHVPIRE